LLSPLIGLEGPSFFIERINLVNTSPSHILTPIAPTSLLFLSPSPKNTYPLHIPLALPHTILSSFYPSHPILTLLVSPYLQYPTHSLNLSLFSLTTHLPFLFPIYLLPYPSIVSLPPSLTFSPFSKPFPSFLLSSSSVLSPYLE